MTYQYGGVQTSKSQTIKYPDVIEEERLRIHNEHKQIALEVTIFARK